MHRGKVDLDELLQDSASLLSTPNRRVLDQCDLTDDDVPFLPACFEEFGKPTSKDCECL